MAIQEPDPFSSKSCTVFSTTIGCPGTAYKTERFEASCNNVSAIVFIYVFKLVVLFIYPVKRREIYSFPLSNPRLPDDPAVLT